MTTNPESQIIALGQSPLCHLQARYAELFGEKPPSGNRAWLIRRIAWRLQAIAEGGLSERARCRAFELANDADLRLSAPGHQPQARLQTRMNGRDPRLPPPGTTLVRQYKGRTIEVKVLADC